MKHWILTPDRAQTITVNLDRNLMTLSAARNYFAAYGVEIKGRTKESFIKNLWRTVQGSDNYARGGECDVTELEEAA